MNDLYLVNNLEIPIANSNLAEISTLNNSLHTSNNQEPQ